MPREGIGRFAGKNEFSDVEFLEIFKEILPHVQSGEIDLDSIKSVDMVEKMDSSFVHFGINPAGKFFMESSNSGEVTADDYQQRFSHTFMSDYKAAFASLLENKLLQSTLMKVFKKVGAIRYDAELFPVLTHTGDESGYITFVATKYDKAKFGTKGAFVVFKSWIKDENAQWTRPEPKKNIALIGAIENADSAEWRIYTNEKHAKLSGVVQLKAINVDKMLASPEAIDDAIEVLSARGNTTIKAHLKNVIADLKEKLQGVLDKYAEETSSIFSKPDSPSSIEGVVLRIKKANGDIFEIKGTSNAFDTLKKQTWATRSSLAELEAVTEGSFLKDALGLKTAQAAALNRAIKEFGAKFTSKEKNPEKREHEFLLKLFDEMRNKDAMVPPEETKKRVNQIFEVAKNQLAVIVDEFKSQKIDPDSKRKSLESLKAIIEKFDTIEKTVNTDMPDEAFQLYIFKFMLDRRLKQYAGQHMNAAEQDYSKFYEGVTPVIIWNGRAQPWHRGHDAMIQLAKKKLEELGAEKILILIVKGGKTSMNKEENPLTEKDQKALVEAVYAGDDSVVVSDTPLANGSLFAIIQKLGEMKAYMVGWLAGNDRIEDYKKLLGSFNASVWLKDHASLPIKVNAKGVADVQMIETPRVMSGTAARESAKTSDFKTWLANVAPPHSQKNKEAVGIYKQIYQLLNSMKAESLLRDMIRKKFTESVVLNELFVIKSAEDYKKAQEILNTGDDKAKEEARQALDQLSPEQKQKFESGDEDNEAPTAATDDETTAAEMNDGGLDEFTGTADDIPSDVIKQLQEKGINLSDDRTHFETEDGESLDFGEVVGLNPETQTIEIIDGEGEGDVAGEMDVSTSVTPEQKAELERNLRKYSMVKDPEGTSKAIKSVAGALAGGLIWAMKAENQKGGDAAEGFKSKVVDGYKAIVDKIKKGKAKANEINKMVRENALLFQQLIKSYRETKVAARKAFGDDKAFNERAAKLRPTYAKNAKELNDKSTKAMESAEVSGLKYVFKTILQDGKLQKYHQKVKKIMAKSDKLKDSKKILDSYISEMSREGISIKAINQYLKDDDMNALAKNISSTPQTQPPKPQQKTP